MVKCLLAIALLLPLAAGCRDSRLPEERAADRLAVSLSQRLKIEQRRLEARERTMRLQRDFDTRVANLRRHYGEGN